MNYWFTADLHINHKNIIKYCNRPFNFLDDMDNTILNNLYNSIKENEVFCPICKEQLYSPFDKMYITIKEECYTCNSDNRLADNILNNL